MEFECWWLNILAGKHLVEVSDLQTQKRLHCSEVAPKAHVHLSPLLAFGK